MKITYETGVFEELVNLSAYLAEVDEEIAQSFLNACDTTFQFLAANRFVRTNRKFKSGPNVASQKL